MEMLVATVVLALLTTLIVQSMNHASRATLGSSHRIDSDGAARTAIGIMESDLTMMVRRPRTDVDVVFAKIVGNDKMFFYSQAPGYLPTAQSSSKSPFSLVGYRINDAFQLERLGKGLLWSNPGGLVFLNFESGVPTPQSTLAGAWGQTIGTSPSYKGSDDDYQIISDEIFRFEFCFMDRSGRFFQPDSFWCPWSDDNNDGISNLNEVRAIVVAVAVLDKKSRQMAHDLGALQAELTDPTDADLQATPPVLMAAKWKQKIESPGFATRVGVPAQVAGAVRVYQRVIPLCGK